MTGKQKAISIHHLSKSYAIGKQKDSSLRNSLANIFKKKDTKVDTFWALKNISFDVEEGEVIGIIGRNGAGKSTLLKVLSKITQPTTGRIEINGRVASLLEVGTGFHPELTGRENIYLNGTLLGMTRKEVSEKLEEIVEFSGVRKFIDTPVKHYSSGMYVRLAFSVAAHLEPEILIVDEVLAVGDAEFQKKCLGKMKDVAGEGRTVIFVSHDLVAVKNLCSRAILLKSGRIHFQGEVEDVIDTYISEQNVNLSNKFINNVTLRNDVFIKSFEITSHIETGKPFNFKVIINSSANLTTDFAIAIRTLENNPLMHIYSGHVGENFKIKEGDNTIFGEVEILTLGAGLYNLNLWLGFGKVVYDFHQEAISILVNEGAIRVGGPVSTKNGYPIITNANWKIK